MKRTRRRNPANSLSKTLDNDFLWIIFAGGAWLAYLLITRNSATASVSGNAAAPANSNVIPGSTNDPNAQITAGSSGGGWED